MSVRQSIQVVTDRVVARSIDARRDSLERVDEQRQQGVRRASPSCGNLARGFAACALSDKAMLSGFKSLNVGITTSYNDILGAHQPHGIYPKLIKDAVRSMGATAHMAGGLPAMCDGVIQDKPGMDLSLFSRVFHSQTGLQQSFKDGELNSDHIAVVRFQGPRSIGMPELSKLIPALGVVQDRGLKVALLTDGRISGASGKVPEASDGDEISKIWDGDIIRKELCPSSETSNSSCRADPLAPICLAAVRHGPRTLRVLPHIS